MGIPGLSRDLLPYAHPVAIGTPSQASAESSSIQNLIIDGPSLVYHVYHKLVAYRSTRYLAQSASSPRYVEINQGMNYMLNDFQIHGACILRIYFDGGLPESKRATRLGRMEKLRQQMEIYRTANREFPASPVSAKIQDIGSALWESTAMPPRILTLPPPPFMVASVIEALTSSSSPWRKIIQVVPCEADSYCALAARNSVIDIAILTGDSDLAVHDLGQHGQVTFLNSLQRVPPTPGSDSSSLHGQCLHPHQIASNMRISSLLPLAFERSLDSSASLSIVRQRARDPSREQDHLSSYASFAREFTVSGADIDEKHLNDLDPRTSEIIVELSSSIQMYLTPMLEDTQRDSSWSYGAEIRWLAYSLILNAQRGSGTLSNIADTPGVTEHARKGGRIASAIVPAFTPSQMLTEAANIEALLTTCLLATTDHSGPGSPWIVLTWYMLALHLLQRSKTKLDKPTLTFLQTIRLFGLSPKSEQTLSACTTPSTTWNDIHLLANLHAILYSLRMLKQIIGHILRPNKSPSSQTSSDQAKVNDKFDLLRHARVLQDLLSSMPSIEDLFLNVSHLRMLVQEGDLSDKKLLIAQLQSALEYHGKAGDSPQEERAREQLQSQADNQHHVEHRQTKLTGPSKKRRKNLKSPPGGVAAHSPNMFDILSDEAG